MRLTTLEREAHSLKRIGDEVYHLQQQMDGERLTRETTLGLLQSELQQLLSEHKTKGACRGHQWWHTF